MKNVTRFEWDNNPECYDDGDCIFEELLRSCDGAEGANTNFDTTFNKSTGPSTKTSEPITDALTSDLSSMPGTTLVVSPPMNAMQYFVALRDSTLPTDVMGLPLTRHLLL